MHLPARLPALFLGLLTALSAAVAALALWTFSRARTPFDYMVVGALVAALGLACVFASLVDRRRL